MDLMKLVNNKIAVGVIVGVVAIALAGGGYFYYQKTQAGNSVPANPQAAQEEVKKLVEEVGKLIDLPQGETPTIATVTDVSKLKDQPFFQKAKNGDKVLIYTNARKAILYDPQAKKVIDVAPINIGTQSAQITQPKVVLRNGTSSVGLTLKVENELKKTYSQLNVVDKENAAKTDYEKTVVVVLNDNGKELASNLAKTLKAEIGELPKGETKPKDGDVLVILGKDSI